MFDKVKLFSCTSFEVAMDIISEVNSKVDSLQSDVRLLIMDERLSLSCKEPWNYISGEILPELGRALSAVALVLKHYASFTL